jgi:hypothetical protein
VWKKFYVGLVLDIEKTSQPFIVNDNLKGGFVRVCVSNDSYVVIGPNGFVSTYKYKISDFKGMINFKPARRCTKVEATMVGIDPELGE